ncbi:hypothetical protein ACOSQ2_023866 [Xanthoceras sorbifolium]
MDQQQQPNFTKSHLLDLSVHDDNSFGGDEWYDQEVTKNKPKAAGNMSEEELKIRGELESEIESNLEEEIKDAIYHLALRLHRLYKHQKERNNNNNAKKVIIDSGGDYKKNKTISEVNICIKMEGGTKIEIKEMKKEAPDKGITRPWTSSRSENMLAAMVVSNNNKKFDWANSLRSSGKGPTHSPLNNTKSNHQAKILSNNIKYQGYSPKMNSNKRNLIGSSEKRKVDNKMLEVGWKC